MLKLGLLEVLFEINWLFCTSMLEPSDEGKMIFIFEGAESLARVQAIKFTLKTRTPINKKNDFELFTPTSRLLYRKEGSLPKYAML